ncbi:MAG: gluconate 2-dehydrogenase subunit 3 family protein [Bacteroidetes bacterium]|nr:gluconate 2-dehydrogenase subunit 3 family protein [Fibrella sp.]
MNRRQAIERVSLLLGGLISAPALAGINDQRTWFGPSVLVTPEQEVLLAELADVIIPTTTTPGAKAAGVQQFIVRVMQDCYEMPKQERFYAGLATVETDSKTQFGSGFAALDAAQKIALVTQLMARDKPFFLTLKELTVAGYFTSEIGATKALAYLPVPGRLDGCVPLEKGQKAWQL